MRPRFHCQTATSASRHHQGRTPPSASTPAQNTRTPQQNTRRSVLIGWGASTDCLSGMLPHDKVPQLACGDMPAVATATAGLLHSLTYTSLNPAAPPHDIPSICHQSHLQKQTCNCNTVSATHCRYPVQSQVDTFIAGCIFHTDRMPPSRESIHSPPPKKHS